MSQELHASIVVPLPDEAIPQADLLHRFSTAWATFLKATGEAAIAPLVTIGPVRQRRRRRKGRLQVVEPPSAA